MHIVYFANNLRTPQKRRAHARKLPDPAISLSRETTLTQAHFKAALYTVKKELTALYGNPHSGTNRHTFLDKDVVYKIPRTFHWGIGACKREVLAYEEQTDHLPMATCRLVYHQTGLPIVIMQKVQTNMLGKPAWATRIDGSQVGLTAEKKWVVFDAGEKLFRK